ncbi:hypothetical protein SLA_6621 [Streptomyces laurentii]|uniref:Uncharacterized protein n=1 Tax=Streptomyces laurentii TaxID=39478 RepID=A0A160P6J6_STRLU|nr:hypothetical protein SLA_6621 [Streptomyces laurentii]
MTSLGPLVAVARGAASPSAANAVAVTARVRAARMVEPPVEDAPKRRPGSIDEYAFHDEPSQAGTADALRYWAAPVSPEFGRTGAGSGRNRRSQTSGAII